MTSSKEASVELTSRFSPLMPVTTNSSTASGNWTLTRSPGRTPAPPAVAWSRATSPGASGASPPTRVASGVHAAPTAGRPSAASDRPSGPTTWA